LNFKNKRNPAQKPPNNSFNTGTKSLESFFGRTPAETKVSLEKIPIRPMTLLLGGLWAGFRQLVDYLNR